MTTEISPSSIVESTQADSLNPIIVEPTPVKLDHDVSIQAAKSYVEHMKRTIPSCNPKTYDSVSGKKRKQLQDKTKDSEPNVLPSVEPNPSISDLSPVQTVESYYYSPVPSHWMPPVNMNSGILLYSPQPVYYNGHRPFMSHTQRFMAKNHQPLSATSSPPPQVLSYMNSPQVLHHYSPYPINVMPMTSPSPDIANEKLDSHIYPSEYGSPQQPISSLSSPQTCHSFHSSTTPSPAPIGYPSYQPYMMHPLMAKSVYSAEEGERKRRRSAPREALRFCGAFPDCSFTRDFKVNETHDETTLKRVRVWVDDEKKIFFDCFCERRKPTQDLRKILKHTSSHDVTEYTCETCGRIFKHHLGLNSHQRIHKKDE